MNEISPINFFKFYQSNLNFKIIDVRNSYEYEQFHINEALNIPYNLLLEKHQLFLNNRSLYFIICKNGDKSYHATKFLSRLGYHTVNVIGGMEYWKGSVETKIA